MEEEYWIDLVGFEGFCEVSNTGFIRRKLAPTFYKVNHLDLDKTNNHKNNLEWSSNLDNMRHAFANGVYKERDKTTLKNLGKYAKPRKS